VPHPRSRPMCSMPAPSPSGTLSPFKASREISACSGGAPSPCRDKQRAEVVAVQGDGVGIVVQAGSADVRGRGMLQ
jgi:hypothetical protein